MASQRTTPAEPADEPAAPDDPAETPAGALFVGEYLDEIPRTYQFDAAGPQTAELGDVCALPHDPGDGRWKASTRKLTRLADNHPDQREITSKRQGEARLKAHRDATEAAEGGEQR